MSPLQLWLPPLPGPLVRAAIVRQAEVSSTRQKGAFLVFRSTLVRNHNLPSTIDARPHSGQSRPF
jgi:hypothetical protein